MTVVLTGDVHHHIDSADRRHASESESELAVEYARIADRHGLKVTLFVTGRAVRDDAADAEPLRHMANVEIGGHGWDAFTPRRFYSLLNRLSGSPHGFRFWQRRTIAMTCAALEEFAGGPVRTWRNHAYLHDAHTPVLLAEAGVAVWSDDADPARSHPYSLDSGLVVLPLNTTPDHENLYHGDRTPNSPLDRPALHPAEWRDRVVDEAGRLAAYGGVATILAHPLCMKVADDWRTFDELCASLATQRSVFASEAARLATSKRHA